MKEEKYLILLIVLISLTVISTSFAYFTPNIIRENVNDTNISSGNISVHISDNKVNATNIAPIYDKDMESLAFKKEFSIISSSTLNSCNKIYLDITSISDSLKSEYFKYKIVGEEESYEGNFLSSNNNEKMILIDNVFLKNNESKNYKLYIWISYQDEIDQIDMLGTSVSAKLSIESYDAENKENCVVK